MSIDAESYKKSLFQSDPLRYLGDEKADIRFFDGALRHVCGAQHYQVVRAARQHPETQDNYGWTYNHAPMLCWWNHLFFVEYLSNPVSEHVTPSHTLLAWSENGMDWGIPKVVFPIYVLPEGVYTGPDKDLLKKGDAAVMHQRMGFYVTKDNRLFILGFYGVSPQIHTNPNNGYGIARVVREVYKDLTFSPIYVIRYNKFGGFTEKDISFPFYQESSDKGFIQGCEELLENKLATRQWWEEERLDTEFFPQGGAAAFCYYTRPDGKTVGLYKNSLVNLSEDQGETWGDFIRCRSIETSTGKMWGEKTSDGNYALIYNPSTDSMHRWPLAVAVSKDGQNFSALRALTTQVPPSRYEGWAKNFGPQYVRGIEEGYPKPDDGCMWLTYSMNKEDIWVCRIQTPIEDTETQCVNEDFSNGLRRWNIYSPKWAKVSLNLPDHCLEMSDSDPCDKAVAERTFIPSAVLEMETEISFPSLGHAGLYIDLCDNKGATPVRIHFQNDGAVRIKNGGAYVRVAPYSSGTKYLLCIHADCVLNEFKVRMLQEDTEVFAGTYRFSESVFSLERILFQTKDQINPYNLESNGKDGSIIDWENSSDRCDETRVRIFSLRTKDHIPYIQ